MNPNCKHPPGARRGYLSGAALVTGLLFVVVPAVANQPPVAVGDWASTHARQAVLIDLLANDGDADGDPLAVPTVTPPSYGAVENRGDGTVVYTPDPALFEGSGGDSFSYTVSDGRGGSDTALVSIAEVPVPAERKPIPEPAVLMQDDFDDNALDGWNVLDHPDSVEGPSNWWAASGHVWQDSNNGTPPSVLAYGGGSAWTDYHAEVSFWSGDDDGMGLAFRFQGVDAYYSFIWSNFFDEMRLQKRQGDLTITLASRAGTYRNWDPYRLEVQVEGPRMRLTLDGELLFDVVDSTYASGTVGLLTERNTGTYFDDVLVTEVPEPAPVLLQDDFSDGDLAGWLSADTGQYEYPSTWRVENGEVLESSNIHTSTFYGVAGANLLAEGGGSWTDYRFRVKFRAGDNDSMILHFRFQDWQNHYALHWNQQANVLLLRKIVDGELTDMVTVSGGYAGGRNYLIEIVADGPVLEAYIDGKLMLTAVDDTFRAGTVGLSAAAMHSIVYDNVLVTAIP